MSDSRLSDGKDADSICSNLLSEYGEKVVAKVSWRLLPFMLLLYIIAYLDRINISFAGAAMKRELGFSDEVFGTGAGIFFLGYFLFGVPSNMMVAKFGARRWIAAIMIIWGFVSVSLCLVRELNCFYILRFLLGVAEAGFFPGMILYLTYWFPRRQHAQAVARFMTAIPLAGVLGGLISSRILLVNEMGIPGWKWLFIITGMPAVLFGFLVLFVLSDSPAQANWLKNEERDWLLKRIEFERLPQSSQAVRQNIFANLRVWHLAILYFSMSLGMYGFQLWLPQIIQNFDSIDDSSAALLSAIPALFQALGMVIVAWHSDRRQERRFHVAFSALLAATGLFLCGFSDNPIFSLGCLCLAAFGIWGTVGPFWAVPTSYLSAASAAAGIGIINSVGSLGGFTGPFLVGFIKSRAPNFIYSLAALAVSLVVACLLALLLQKEVKADAGEEQH